MTDETVFEGFTNETIADNLTEERAAHDSAKETVVDRLMRPSKLLDLVGVMIIQGMADGKYFSKQNV